MKRRTAKHLRKEFEELHYLTKLSDKDKEWMIQFMYEYYQADFNYETVIHPEEFKKDCRHRNNASKRQIHSVGNNLLMEAAVRAINIENGLNPRQKARFYTHLDYLKDLVDDKKD